MPVTAVLPSDQDLEDDHGHASLVEATIEHGFPLLTFPKTLEDRFLRDGLDRRFVIIAVAGLVSLALFAGLMLADRVLMPDIVGLGLALRIGVYAPVTLTGLYLLHRLRRPLLTEWMVAGGGLLAGLLSILMYTRSSSQWALPAVVELNIVVVFVCAFARFWPALALSALIGLAHAWVVATVPDFTGIVAANSSLLLATTVGFTLYGNYKLEHDERMAFLLELREKALDAESISAHHRLASMATTDPLTGLANRRYFDEFLAESTQRAQHEGRPLSLALIDIDYFKRYNDHHGHQAGDRCLVAVAKALIASMRRPGDLVARWGGEEFAIVMTDADEAAANAAGERVRDAVQGLGLPHPDSACAPAVSVSVGLASWVPQSGQSMSLSQLVQQADVALYDAKTAGRNRVSRGQQQQTKPEVCS